MRPPEFWQTDGAPARLLAPLARLYGVAVGLRARGTRPARVPVPVICVGNLTVGGTGKTPVALDLGRRLSAASAGPHFLTRGYRGRLAGPVRVDPARHDAAAVGDEALLLAEVAPTWVARRRDAGAMAAAEAGAGLIVMDDGFQNSALAKDLALVVVDGAEGFGNGRLLPAGPLREPVAAGLVRASAVVRIGPDRAGTDRLLPAGLPLLEAELRPDAGAEQYHGARVVAFAGIGRPDKLFAALRGLGAELVATRAFADHHRFRSRELVALCELARRKQARLVTTAKDFVRLPAGIRRQVEVLAVGVRWRDEAALERLLAPLLGSRRLTIR